jgi:hypothetical protein
MPPPLLGPPVEAVKHALPRSELRRKIPPRNTRSSPPKHSLDEPTIVLARPTDASLTFEDLVNPLPLLIG